MPRTSVASTNSALVLKPELKAAFMPSPSSGPNALRKKSGKFSSMTWPMHSMRLIELACF
jgi:hypothetical protein